MTDPRSALSKKGTDVLLCLALLALLLAVYWPVGRFEFINYDDPQYITDNPRVQAGLTAENVSWAFRTFFFNNWHPLTWLSYMFDFQLFGLNAGAFHLVNVFFHGLNTLLLFVVLKRMTGARWPSALVAALFAVHPLHVESVAWVAERKDVLSTFFGMLTLLAYVRYVEQPRLGRYLIALLFFALGLMAKPMLVTLPFALLLLDFWPLGRSQWGGTNPKSEIRNAKQSPNPKGRIAPNRTSDVSSGRDSEFGIRIWPASRLLLEKIPFLLLAAAASIVTYIAQHGPRVGASNLPMTQRIANALVSYTRYIGKTIWPHNLAVYYPYHGSWLIWQVGGAALVLGMVTVLALWLRRKGPYLIVGWLWFTGTLVPVIGLVQVGGQAMADRYTYVPMIGLLIMFAWGAVELGAHWRIKKIGLIVSSSAVLLGCVVASIEQVRLWSNSKRLFEHALKVTDGSTLAHINLGAALVSAGQTNEALGHFSAALEINPRDYLACENWGNVLLDQGKIDEAIAKYQMGLQSKPNNPELNHHWGTCLARQGRFAEAIPYLTKALQFRPEFADAYLDLGNTWLGLGKFDEALTNYATVLRLQPHSAPAHFNLGNVLVRQGKDTEAAAHYVETLRWQPNNAEAHAGLAVGLARQGKNREAMAHLTEALRIKPGEAQFHYQLASALKEEKRTVEAVAQYQDALRLKPNSVLALNNLAWILATDGDAAVRNGPEAVRNAERVCELTGRRQASFLGTLAAAYAEAGRFPEAVTAVEKAIELATAADQKDLVATNQKLLELYRASQPYHESKRGRSE